MRHSHTFFATLALITLLLPPAAQAAVFNPNRILEDAVLRESDAMNYAEIRAFMQRKGGLADVVDVDPADGLLKNAAQLVADAASRYKVNPEYLLALIQKESSAVETDAPTIRQLEAATGYALCDGCYRNDPMAVKFRGFAKQVDAGAGWIDWYYKNAEAGTALRNAGESYGIGDLTVTPQNVATAALYSYTPHLHGNLLLWTIWNRWFGDGSVGLRLPDGTLARDAKTGAVALVQGGKYRPIANVAVLTSRFSGNAPVDVDHDVFEGFLQQARGRTVQFSDFSLVRTEAGAIYLLVGNQKRHIASMEAFKKTGFNPEEVEDAKADDLADYADGEPITTDTQSAIGELLQDTKTGGIYYVENGTKHPLLDRALLALNFAGEPIGHLTNAALNGMKTGAPVKFDDGLLVKTAGSAAVYVISGGQRRLIPSEDVFLSYGYRWTNVVTISKKMLELHPLGKQLEIEMDGAAETPTP